MTEIYPYLYGWILIDPWVTKDLSYVLLAITGSIISLNQEHEVDLNNWWPEEKRLFAIGNRGYHLNVESMEINKNNKLVVFLVIYLQTKYITNDDAKNTKSIENNWIYESYDLLLLDRPNDVST